MASGLPPASSTGHKFRLPELVLGPLLVLLLSGLGPVVGQKLYTNTWAVHIPGGQEVADQVANKHGFINYGHVSSVCLFFLHYILQELLWGYFIKKLNPSVFQHGK